MMKLAIDGQKLNGHYRVDCECGDTWSGIAQQWATTLWSPAMPIAECVAHIRLSHPEREPDIRFTSRFTEWLMQYWERVSAMQVGGANVLA